MLRPIEVASEPSPTDWPLVQVVRNPVVFAGMRAQWSALLEQSDAAIFNGWEWLYPWYRRIATGIELWVLTARDRHGKLVGVLPLAREQRQLGPISIRRLCFLGEERVGTDYLDVVALPHLRRRITQAFARELLEQAADWELLDLNDIDERSPTPDVLAEFFGGTNYEVRAFERFQCPNETFLEGESFEQFLHRTRRRENYLRRRKWMEAQEGYRLEITTDPAKLTRPVAELFRLHTLRWKENGGSTGISGPRLEAFHRDATHLLAEAGKLRLYTLWLKDKALASVYGIVHRGTFHYYQSGMDPEWRSKSVGLVLVGATFEDAIRSKLRHYDFLRGTETYKSDWASKLRRTTRLRVAPRTGIGAWVARGEDATVAVKAMVKGALPEAAIERIRSLRRRWNAQG